MQQAIQAALLNLEQRKSTIHHDPLLISHVSLDRWPSWLTGPEL